MKIFLFAIGPKKNSYAMVMKSLVNHIVDKVIRDPLNLVYYLA